ncbi:MAG: alkylhydroperoxidase-related (seleno)protein, partial [Actinomycetota bacterium]|nr:alkylhydroperoxidase-related (seleno)protein [Actinomycetota bacterium]
MALYDTQLPVRDDLDAAHAAVLDRWSRPGSWWSGAERLAIVEEVRRARDADELAPWVAPSSVDGLIADDHPLPSPAVDAVWRLTNHPGTLTAEWHSSIIDRGLEPAAYVELVAVVAQANDIDRFAEALELGRPALPEPQDGDPSKSLGDDVDIRRHWVPTADVKGPNVLKALSAVPFENETLSILSDAQYLPVGSLMGDLVSDQNSLSRLQIELIAARTSKLN